MPPRPGKGARGKTAPPIPKAVAAAKAAASSASSSSKSAAAAAAASSSANEAADAVPSTQNALNPKDAALLAQVFQQYEEKKYAASVKSADLILKKVPNHAQTLCMKGLSTYNLGKREEGKELARKGLALDLKSHVCWHVNALIHRADREYVEALKCYTQANKIEPNDMNVIRDLVNLQLHLRKYDAACRSRLHLLKLQPRIRYNWTAVAVAYHLAGNLSKASEYLQAYCDMIEGVPAHDYEYSEVILYRTQVYIEAGELEKARDLLDKEGRRVVDLQSKKELSAAVQKGLGKAKVAELNYAEMLEENPDNLDYVTQYLSCKGIELSSIDESTQGKALQALYELSDRLPRSRTIRKLVLDVATEETFRKRLTAYLVDGLTKGIPSLFSETKNLLKDDKKQKIVLETATSFRKLLEEGKTIEGDDADSNAEEAPTTYIWLLYYLAQVQLHLKSYAQALDTIDTALRHTPVLPELYMIKARILKRSGNLLDAEEAMSQARLLDGQDRFLNAKHVKYLMRVDEVEKAEEIAGLFTRKDAESPLADLTDMQCLWFLLAEGDSYRRQGKLNLALKRYHTVEKIFSEIYEDEIEFHQYCMRKFTLRACVNMARSNDTLRKHPAFLKAARGAIEIYLQLDQQPYQAPVTSNGTHEVNGAGTTDGDASQTQGAEDKTPKDAESKADAKADPAKKDDVDEEDKPPLVVDDDPNGDKLVATKNPLEALNRFVDHLEPLGADNAEVQDLLFQVAMRKKQYARALRALQLHAAVAKESPILHYNLLRFATELQSADATDGGISSEAKSALQKASEGLLPVSPESYGQYNSLFLQSHPNDAEAVLAVAKAGFAISGGQDKQSVVEMLGQLAREENQPSLDVLARGLTFLRDTVQADDSAVDSFVASAKKLFPSANVLQSTEEREAQKAAIAEARKKESMAGNEDVKA